MTTQILTEDTFEDYARIHYDDKNSHHINFDDFYAELNRFNLVNRHFRKFKSTGKLQERLICNHIIIISNLFGISACCEMFYFRIEEAHHPQLTAFLKFLNHLPEPCNRPIDTDITDILNKM